MNEPKKLGGPAAEGSLDLSLKFDPPAAAGAGAPPITRAMPSIRTPQFRPDMHDRWREEMLVTPRHPGSSHTNLTEAEIRALLECVAFTTSTRPSLYRFIECDAEAAARKLRSLFDR